ncbi:MAG: hypothetical protein OEZ02_10300, partial [Anaerolineae bacterium]|nr:hypothetical protein [Anaerolineae bacterium]
MPKRSGGWTHSWARRPVVNSTLDLVAPWPMTRAMPGCSTKACMTAAESGAATSRSISPTVADMRRRLPAASAATTPGTARSKASCSWASGQASRRGVRPVRRASDS